MFQKTTIIISLFFSYCLLTHAQEKELLISYLKNEVATLKKDPRGPYKRIRWFCKDGSIREPRDPCPDSIGGGIQHASYKDEIIEIGKKHHIYFGDILAYTNKKDFWDEAHQQSRLKQYQLGKYLSNIDDGWITRRSRYYRGAIQSEDEEAWGIEFYKDLLKNDSYLEKHYYLIRQSLRDIPHDGDTNLAQLIRSESKLIAEELPKFMDIRIKIHGRPDSGDIALVNEFIIKNKNSFTPEINKKFKTLTNAMNSFYTPTDFAAMAKKMDKLQDDSPLKSKIFRFLNTQSTSNTTSNALTDMGILLCDIRTELYDVKKAEDRLLLLDFSNDIENIFLKTAATWQPKTVDELLQKIYILSKAATGTGLLENWEWSEIQPELNTLLTRKKISLKDLRTYLRLSQSLVEWSASRVKATYNPIVNKYTQFEPKVIGFIDDRIRSSIALPLGETVSQLSNYVSTKVNLANKVFKLENTGSFRGLNPGYAFGELVVVKGTSENTPIDASKIYVFDSPPSNLKPVAGILTVSEGNLVSHVQLLARNLGIPNSALSDTNLENLYAYNRQRVFYAVSASGTVILKTENEMSTIEKALFSKKERSQQKIEVPTDQIKLGVTEILNMRNVDTNDSGKLCGPKAANLGQLKAMFPEQVVEGLIIPFGIFKSHMNQQMPNTSSTYWNFLASTFEKAHQQKNAGIEASQIEASVLSRLKILEEAILQMPLQTSFVNQMKTQFKTIFGNEIGKVPVFLRSDTNMEDLKEFTGAGLNLTLFNVLNETQILQGIKQVWASPYTERSFKWRQKYLTNPENVYPSILIIPSVDVEYSGVMITKGINVGEENDLTVAFSRGAGGAVDGQSAETWLITKDESYLLAPARQNEYLRLPTYGGTKTGFTTFETSILNKKNKQDIRTIAKTIRSTAMGNKGEPYKGAYDVELGFQNDKLWLFQIRPFVENKQAKSSDYLQSISPKIDETQQILISEKL